MLENTSYICKPQFSWLTADYRLLLWSLHVGITKLNPFISEDRKQPWKGWVVCPGPWGGPVGPQSLKSTPAHCRCNRQVLLFQVTAEAPLFPTAGRFWLNTADLRRALQSDKRNHQMGWGVFSNWSQVGFVAWVSVCELDSKREEWRRPLDPWEDSLPFPLLRCAGWKSSSKHKCVQWPPWVPFGWGLRRLVEVTQPGLKLMCDARLRCSELTFQRVPTCLILLFG